MSITGRIVAYESGELDGRGIIELFAELVSSGLAWQLQGTYGRTAQALIEGGALDEQGNILFDLDGEDDSFPEGEEERWEPDEDGPAGDYLNDYWYTAGGPDEPPDYSDDWDQLHPEA